MKPRKTRDPDRRRLVRVPERLVRGHVSPNDIKAYLTATGWSTASNPFVMAREVAGKWSCIMTPLDDASGRDLEGIIGDIAKDEKRSPGEVLRAIEARARGDEPPVNVKLAARRGRGGAP